MRRPENSMFNANTLKGTTLPRYEMEALLLHEAVPGHHVETVVGQEIPGLPRFRKFASIAAYSEGWGLYAERLTKEMGLYQDPYSDFGRLALSVMRAARLVIVVKWGDELRDPALAPRARTRVAVASLRGPLLGRHGASRHARVGALV